MQQGYRLAKINWVKSTEICRFEAGSDYSCHPSADYEKIEFPIEFEADVLELIKPVKTDEEAKSVAIDILEKRHKQGKWRDDTLVGILHSTEDNIWRFEYSLDQSDVPVDELVDGSVSYVVIDGNSGKLIAAWAEE